MHKVASVLVIPFMLALLVGAPLTAQAPQPAFPPAQPATDLESALYKAADAIGMLRGPQERDGVVTFEYVSTNTRASFDIVTLCQPAPDVTCAGLPGRSSETENNWRSIGEGRFAVKYTRRDRSSTARIAVSGVVPATMNSPDVNCRCNLPSMPYR